MEKLMIAIPCMETMPVLTCQSLVSLAMPGDTNVVFSIGSLVHDSRNKLAQAALDNGAKYILWLDSDMVWNPGLLKDLEAAMDESGADIVSAMCRMRKAPHSLVQYKTLNERTDGTGWDLVPLETEPDGILEIEACGFGGVLMKTDIVAAVSKVFGNPFDMPQGIGEDLAFCYRARMLGAKIVCDGRIRMGHIGTTIIGNMNVPDREEARKE